MTRALSNPQATPAARRLYNYLCSLQGHGCLTGQMESVWCGTPEHEMNYLLMRTGRLPAIRGLDFIDNDFAGVVRRAMEWHARGGIVTICWHTGPDFSSSYKQSQEEDIDWTTALTPGTPAYDALIAGMDRAAPYLKRLQFHDIPVLWRPFHEMDGKWFWWGRGGAEGSVKLWRLMYDRYTNHHGLNNLIWVWNAPVADRYPGDDVVDLISRDMYPPAHEHTAQMEKLLDLQKITRQPKIPLIGETGTIPSAEALAKEQAAWASYMTWCGDFALTENNTTHEELRAMYNHPWAITKDRLPELY